MKRILSASLLGLFVLGSCRLTTAQPATSVSHVALYVFDLQKSVDFYKNVLGLKQIPEPFKDGKHVWLRMGPHSQLHIIQGAAKVEPHDKNSHLAFSVKDLKKFTARLDDAGVRYGSWTGDEKRTTVRPDGVEQVYLQDADQFWVEVNNDTF
ncbi:MAG: hypothetical protein NVS3B25_18570 [Hymenobacter sp.]